MNENYCRYEQWFRQILFSAYVRAITRKRFKNINNTSKQYVINKNTELCILYNSISYTYLAECKKCL
jgi:hypothetical protein